MEVKLFLDFSEYWKFGKFLTEKQRKIILSSMSEKNKNIIEKSYIDEGWADLFLKNKIDAILDEIERKYGCNLLSLRGKILEGKNVFVKKTFWKDVQHRLSGYPPEHVNFILGGFKAEESSTDEFKLVLQ